MRLLDELKKTEITFDTLIAEHPELADIPPEAREQVEIDAKYAGYIDRAAAEERRFRWMEGMALPQDADYMHFSGLRIEARQKLNRQKPASLGQASRIPGVSPADVEVLMIWLEKERRVRRTEE